MLDSSFQIQIQTRSRLQPGRIFPHLAVLAAIVLAGPASLPADTGATLLHDIGEPTDQEQYLLELLNRARANPAAEAARLAATTDPDIVPNYDYYGLTTNLTLFQTELSALPAAPPLAPNKALIAAGRSHSQWMLATQQQFHEEDRPDGTLEPIDERFKRAGYAITSATAGADPGTVAENIYAAGVSLDECRASFEVDWGYNEDGETDHGMQTGRGHRLASHSAAYREVGIGVVFGVKESTDAVCSDLTPPPVGPMLVTEEYGRSNNGSSTPFVTGVAWADLDGDGFYSPGEGVGGVTVTVSGAAVSAITSKSGGYAIPRTVTGNSQVVTVSFSGPGISQTATATITNKMNVKADLKLAYAPPTPAGPATVVRGVPATFTFATVPGATGHTSAVGTKTAAPAWDGGSFTKATLDTAGAAYTTIDATVASTSPGSSWHLAHPYTVPCQILRPQTILLTPKILCTAGTQLSFKSRLRGSRPGQAARAQVSSDGGLNWKTVFTQRGFATGAGETAFSAKSVNLGAWAGRLVQVRFAYTAAATGTIAQGATAAYGWFIDDVSFSTAAGSAATQEITLTDQGATGAGSFTFTPTATGAQQLYVRPVVPGKNWPYSPPLEITVIEPTGYKAACVSAEISLGMVPGTLSLQPAADFDRDGISNLVEYACKLNPVVNNSTTRLLTPVAKPPTGKGAFTWQRDTTVTGATLVIQASVDGVNWFTPGQTGAPAGMGLTDSVLSTAGTVETRQASAFHQGKTLLFRLKATVL